MGIENGQVYGIRFTKSYGGGSDTHITVLKKKVVSEHEVQWYSKYKAYKPGDIIEKKVVLTSPSRTTKYKSGDLYDA